MENKFSYDLAADLKMIVTKEDLAKFEFRMIEWMLILWFSQLFLFMQLLYCCFKK